LQVLNRAQSERAYLSDEFLDRVRAAYRLATNLHASHSGPVWQPINERRADIHGALIAEDNREIRRIFADPVSTDLFYGTDGICRSIFGQLQNDRVFQEHVDRGVSDLINEIAKAMGDSPAGNPETSFAYMDTLLAQHINFPSPFPGEIGFATSRGLSSERAVRALYEVYRATTLLGSNATKRVIEIGPGVGRSALYGHRAGLDYSTVDLPLGMVAQACFLGAVLGPNKLWFEGENDSGLRGRIKLFAALPDRSFDIALNVDSMVEMPSQVAIDYVLWLKQNASVFVSINHAFNAFTVAQILTFTAAGNCRKRGPCPMWPAYEEGIYDMRHGGTFLMPARLFALRAFISLQHRRRVAADRRRTAHK
jgi:hypothetical protein